MRQSLSAHGAEVCRSQGAPSHSQSDRQTEHGPVFPIIHLLSEDSSLELYKLFLSVLGHKHIGLERKVDIINTSHLSIVSIWNPGALSGAKLA